MLKRREVLGLAAGAAILPVACFGALAEDGAHDMILGDPDAPIEIIEYASMTCSHCAGFHADTLPDLKKHYIDTGRARLVFREYPLDHLALAVSALARCGGKDRFFGFIDVLFRTQEQWIQAEDPIEELRTIVRAGGRDPALVDSCIDDETTVRLILEGMMEAQSTHNVRSTPTLVISGTVVAGNPGFAALDEMLQEIEAGS